MKNILLEILIIVSQYGTLSLLLPALIGFIIGFIKSYRTITDKRLSIYRRLDGIMFCLLCVMSCLGVFGSLILTTLYFYFHRVEIVVSMCLFVIITGLLIRLVLNFERLRGGVSR